MASFSCELRVDGHVFPVLLATYQTSQATDSRGRVVEKVRRHPVELLLDVPGNNSLGAWAVDAHKRLPAALVFCDAATGNALETLSLAAAYCVHYSEAFHAGDRASGAYTCAVVLSDPGGWTWHAVGPEAYAAPAVGSHGTPPVAAAVAAAGSLPGGLTKKQRYDARMKKLTAARAHLADGAAPAGTPNPLAAPADATRVAPAPGLRQYEADQQSLQAATDRLARNNVAVERAKLADDAYENEIGPGPDGRPTILRKHPTPDGWKVLQVTEDKQSGFMAVVYQSDFEQPPRKVLAFRGTDVGQANDASTDAMQGIGMDTAQYRETEDIARLLKKSFPEGFDITGHSLGGGEASLAGLLTGRDTYTFNAAGLHVNTMSRANIDPYNIAQAQQKIQAYYSTRDPLSLPQDYSLTSKLVLHGLLLVPEVALPFLKPVTGAIIDDPNSLPGAVGVRRPFVDAGMHPIPPMVARIEQQKTEDLATLDRLVPAR